MKKNLSSNPTEDFEKTAVRISSYSIAANAALSAGKLAAGLLAHSGAMVSDAIHSASDVLSSVIVIIGVRIASRKPDREHPYGHERFECVAAIVLSVILLATGLIIGYNAALSLLRRRFSAQIPGIAALLAAVISIGVKEVMFRITAREGKRIDSPALMADAWHHRSDALSSVGALIGIAGARHGIVWLDTAASLVICVFIVKAAADIFNDAVQKMVDHACSGEEEEAISKAAAAQSGVLGIRSIHTREFGSRIYVDLEVYADGGITLTEASRIEDAVHDGIEETFPKVKHITVRVCPEDKTLHSGFPQTAES